MQHERSSSPCVSAQSIQSSLTLCDPVDCSPPGSSIHGILRQECWSELSCPPPGDQTCVSCGCCIAGGFFIVELPGKLPVPWPGIKPRLPCIGGMWSLRHWTTREVPELNDVLKVPGGGGGLVSKSCLTLFDPEDCSPPDSCVHGISQARILE